MNEPLNRYESDQELSAQVQQVIYRCIDRRAAGEKLSDESLIADHPHLMPLLADALQELRRVQQAQVDTEQTLTLGLKIRCPYCHHRIEVAEEGPLSDIACPACGSQFSLTDDTDRTFRAGRHEMVNHFQLLDRIGAGAFGSVWSARDTQLDRMVALKIPRKGQLGPEDAEQFIREARAAAQLKHPNIVRVLEVGRYQDRIYIACDLIQGVDLAEWLTEQQATPIEAAELCATLADALQHAHNHGVVHRDIKPSNVMLDMSGEPHLMDFGLAKREAGEMTVTVAGKLLGTPAYMSPEQARGAAHDADARSDVYSLGVLLFELLTGERPFRGNTRMLLHQVLTDDAPSPSKLNSLVPRDLETVCLKCLQKGPDQRYQTAADLRDDLRRFLCGEPVMARPVSAVARFARLCRRKPLVTTLSASVAALLLILSIAGPFVAVTQRRLSRMNIAARHQADIERANAERAEAEASAKAQELSWQLYTIHLANADKAILNRDYRRGRLELDACPTDHRSWEWRFLEARIDAEISTQIPGLDAPVFTRDGNQLIAIGPERSPDHGLVNIWDLASVTPVKSFQHDNRPTMIALAPDQKQLACGDFDGGLVVWDVQTRQKLWSNSVHRGQIDGLAFSPDSRWIASASWDKTLKLFDATNGELRFSVGPFKALLRKASFSPDGKWLLSGMTGVYAAGMIIDVATGQIAARFPGKAQTIPTYSPDGRWIATASVDGDITLWNWDGVELIEARSWKALKKRDKLHMVKSLEFSHDSSRLVSGDQSNTCRVTVWDVETGNELAALDAGDTVWWLATSPTSDQVAFFTLSSGMRLWYYGQREEGLSVQIDDTPIRHAKFSPDGRWVSAGTSDASRQFVTGTSDVGKVMIVDTQTGTESLNVDGIGASWTADGTYLVTIDPFDDAIKMYDALRGDFVRSFPAHTDFTIPGVRRFGANQTALNTNRGVQPIGRTKASAILAETGTWLTRYKANDLNVPAQDRSAQLALTVAISRDGKHVAVGHFAEQYFVAIWNTQTQSIKRSIRLLDHLPIELEFTPNGEGVYVGGTGGALSLFSTETGELLKSFQGHSGRVYAIANSPDGSRIVAGDESGKVIVWHVDSRQPLLTLTNGEAGVHAIDWCQDGSRIVAGNDDGSIQIWKLPFSP